MNFQSLKNRIDILMERAGKPSPRGEVLFYSLRQPGDVDDATHFYYSTKAERNAIRERLHALPDGPDIVRIIVHGVTAEEIAAGEAVAS